VNIGGWSGVIFGLGLLIAGGMISLPTAAETGEDIQAFYSAHQHIVIIQQITGALLLVPFVALARTLDRRSRRVVVGYGRWLILAALAVAAAELATNVLALALAAALSPSPAVAHALTIALDLADAALFAAIAFFAVAAAPTEWTWLRGLGLFVAALTITRAFVSPIGITLLDAVAPLAFLAYVLVLSTRSILLDRAQYS
jgi:hypothetical protein